MCVLNTNNMKSRCKSFLGARVKVVKSLSRMVGFQRVKIDKIFIVIAQVYNKTLVWCLSHINTREVKLPRRSRGGHENSQPFSHSPPFFPGSLGPFLIFKATFSEVPASNPNIQYTKLIAKTCSTTWDSLEHPKRNPFKWQAIFGMNVKPNVLPFAQVSV